MDVSSAAESIVVLTLRVRNHHAKREDYGGVRIEAV
jgi:hypothetical protein